MIILKWSRLVIRTFRTAASVAILAGLMASVIDVSASWAQNVGRMSCDELWYARNEIYAAEGYCFKTARAQSVFGPGCFAPFGRLSGDEQRQVNLIQSWERRRGCPA